MFLAVFVEEGVLLAGLFPEVVILHQLCYALVRELWGQEVGVC